MAWLPLQHSRDSLRNPSQVYRNINFSKATGWNIWAPHIVWRWELIPVFDWRGKPSFHKHRKRSFRLGICMWDGACVLCFNRNGPRYALIRKKAKFSCRGFMHSHRSYHKWKDVWVPCRDPTESPRSPPQLEKGPHIPLTIQEPRGFHCFKLDDAWQFWNIVRNHNITVSNRKWSSLSLLTSRRVRIVLRSLA